MIKNIILDYGFVLAYPKTGSWFIPPNVNSILGRKNMIKLFFRMYRFPNAYKEAYQSLNENHLLHTEGEEIEQFTHFYKIFFKRVGLKADIETISKKLSKDLVCNDDKVIFYKDVIEELQAYRSNYRLAILSDTWPSLKRILEHKGITQMLDGLVMSCDYGICKSNIELFHKAIEHLKVEPEHTVFIDDSISNLENAEKAGLIPILMDRRRRSKQCKYPIIRSLGEVKDIIASYNTSSK